LPQHVGEVGVTVDHGAVAEPGVADQRAELGNAGPDAAGYLLVE
jgi:hypothetical protein